MRRPWPIVVVETCRKKKEEVRESWGQLHSKELQDFYSFLDFYRVFRPETV
jgi:hypothetical protein